MTCDGSGHAIGCPGCRVCRPLPAADGAPPPPLNPYAADLWDRISAERDALERRYADTMPTY